MKKLLATLVSVFFICSTTAMAEIGIGVSANYANIDTDGKEVELTGDKETTTASHSNDVLVPEVFVEAIADNGWTVGFAYIPARELGSKSRTDTSPTADTETGDAGTYTAKAEVSNVVQFYTDIPIGPVYAKLGLTAAELKTEEVNPTGTKYGDENVIGMTVGIGYRNDILANSFYKIEATYTDFEEYKEMDSNSDHRVTANTDITSLRLSFGTKF